MSAALDKFCQGLRDDLLLGAELSKPRAGSNNTSSMARLVAMRFSMCNASTERMPDSYVGQTVCDATNLRIMVHPSRLWMIVR